MILHNGLGAPWQLTEGTFSVFSFCKVVEGGGSEEWGKEKTQTTSESLGECLLSDDLFLIILNGEIMLTLEVM